MKDITKQQLEKQAQSLSPIDKNEIVNMTSNMTYEDLSEEDKKHAHELAEKLADNSIESVDKFGSAIQSEISKSSKAMLNDIKNGDMSYLSESLNELVFTMKQVDEKSLKGINKLPIIGKFIQKSRQSLFEVTQKYSSVASNVEAVKDKLDKSKEQLTVGNARIQELYDANLQYFKDLNVYIAALELKIKDLEDNAIPIALKNSKDHPTDLILSEKLNELTNHKDKLERRLTSFKISRNLTLQQAPQLMMMKKSNSDLSDKIDMSITIAVPEWYRQLAMARELMEQKEKIEMTNAFDDALNGILNKNSEFLHDSTIQIAKAKERDIIDIDTLKHSQNNLIATIKEVSQIEHEGAEKRKQVQLELEEMENNLKSQLIEVSSNRSELDKKYRDVTESNTDYRKLDNFK